MEKKYTELKELTWRMEVFFYLAGSSFATGSFKYTLIYKCTALFKFKKSFYIKNKLLVYVPLKQISKIRN